MNSTQKRFLEWPLLLLLLFFEQSLEISVSESLLFGLGHIQLIPVLIVYVALSRSWGQLAWLSAVFAYIASSSSGISPLLIVSTYVWMGLLSKVFVTAFTLESRLAFTALAAGASLLSKGLLWISFWALGESFHLAPVVGGALLTCSVSSVLAYFTFPILLQWDEYFEHGTDRSRELNPTF